MRYDPFRCISLICCYKSLFTIFLFYDLRSVMMFVAYPMLTRPGGIGKT